jgi:hypothetical protein
MTSAHKMLRQRDQATSIFQAPTITESEENPVSNYWYLVPNSGNYVGNYTPGYMMPVPLSKIPAGVLARDMGKTIQAPISYYYGSTYGFFRAVQLITPDGAVSATGNTTFGVYGNAPRSLRPGNIGDMGYRTYYIPIIVNGTFDTAGNGIIQYPAAFPPIPYRLLGGQM